MAEDKIVKKLIEIENELAQVKERLDRTLTRQEYLQGQDEIMTILRRLDQERVFSGEWIRRIETDVTKIKSVLKIS